MTFKSTPKDMIVGSIVFLIAVAFCLAAAADVILITKVKLKMIKIQDFTEKFSNLLISFELFPLLDKF